MKNKGIIRILWMIAGFGLLLTVMPPILVFTQAIDLKLHTTLMALGMLLWFAARIAIQGLSSE